MSLFVTGGSGFVGGAVIAGLADDHRVRAMARSDVSAHLASGAGATPVRCSLDTITTDELTGIDAVIHCAAHVSDWGPAEWFDQANVAGTGRLLSMAKAAGVRRFLHISTESVLFTGDDLDHVDEDTPYPPSTPFDYSRTKGEAERLVLAGNDPDHGFETVIVRPVLVWGPGDRTILPEVLELAEHGRWTWLDRGESLVSPTHIDNLVHGVRLALDRGRPGEIYFVTDEEHVSVRWFMEAYAATAGVTLPDRSIPGWLGRGVARAVETAWGVVAATRKPPLTYFAAASASRDIVIDSDKAARELGYSPVVTVAEGLRRLG